MWIYRGNSLTQRFSLDWRVGFWLDHWLLLNGDLTHSVLAARPLRLASLVEPVRIIRDNEASAELLARKARICSLSSKTKAALKNRAKNARRDQRALKQALIHEIKSVARWMKTVPSAVQPPPFEFSTATDWDRWYRWLLLVSRPEQILKTLESMARDVATAIWRGDFKRAIFLNSKLADQCSGRWWFQKAKHQLCDSGALNGKRIDYEGLTAAIADIFRSGEPHSFFVRIRVLPVSLSTRNVESLPKAIREKCLVLSGKRGGVLTALDFERRATNFLDAAIQAFDAATRVLDQLRVRQHVLVHFCGKIAVRDGNAKFEVPLPGPFWDPDSQSRAVPSVPRHFDTMVKGMGVDQEKRLRAVRRHISSALLLWQDFPHAAAAHVWYGIESFVGKSKTHRGIGYTLAKQYSGLVLPDLDRSLALYVKSQRIALIKACPLERCDWVEWRNSHESLKEWRARVEKSFSVDAPNEWKRPSSPKLLFDENVGLFGALGSGYSALRFQIKIQRRVEADLALLRAGRNSFVHDGSLLFSREMAEYLARVGLEALMACMAPRRNS